MYLNINLLKNRQNGIKLGEFLSKKWKAALILPLALLAPAITEAATNTDAIINAFNPLISLAQSLSFPLAFMVNVGGFLFVIIGQRHKGLEMIKWAWVGYIGVQFVPSIMRILMDVGKAMQQA